MIFLLPTFYCQTGVLILETKDKSKTEQKPKLLDQVRTPIRTKHYSPRTEELYIYWIKKYIFFHKKRHPAEMGEPEIRVFLNYLAVKEKVAASTQNQALCAIIFLYKQITINNAKGGKDRVTPLPERIIEPLTEHLKYVKELHEKDLKDGYTSVYLPYALERKYPNAGR